ncbi:hypothetical protein EPA93_22450 [Ktedonosporobacter rubrisoli]|uniref:Uncharacterized protein n=1 Tax=Ktedonosporobacter rubrisoli TaxID=2509675 RepID=A0A4P6JTG6_KTERU|nr:hypothetical protein [Ktedonosporobacter rubrisoli]QBD78603.1 hypothetical protein EPA93_22450 [Ktedonosporobacter rubrisoli]
MPGVTDQEVTLWLQQHGFETEIREMFTWEQPITPQTHFNSIIHYQATSPWSVSDEIFALSLQRLEKWMHDHFGNKINDSFLEKEQLILSKTRKPS